MTEIDEIRQKLLENKSALRIARIPQKVKEEFTAWADKEFCSDWGMALKWLWDFYKGIMPEGHEEIYARLDMLEAKIAKLEEKKETKHIRTVTGKILKIKRRDTDG